MRGYQEVGLVFQEGDRLEEIQGEKALTNHGKVNVLGLKWNEIHAREKKK